MSTVKDEVRALLDKLPDDCTREDIQYHLYVSEKIQKGIDRADQEGTISQTDIEKEFQHWTQK